MLRRRPVFCDVCRKPYQGSRKDPCPHCADERQAVEERPAPAPLVPARVERADLALDERQCPECAEVIRAEARSCRFCGFDLATRARPRRGSSRAAVVEIHHHGPRTSGPSPGTAALLSVLWVGAGQIYAGRVGRGLLFMFGAPVLALVLLFVVGGAVLGLATGSAGAAGAFALLAYPAALAYWVWQIYDAYACAQQAGGPSRPRPRRRRRKP